MQDMAVTFSDEEFQQLYEALLAFNTPYTHEEVADILIDLKAAWAMVQEKAATHTADLPE